MKAHVNRQFIREMEQVFSSLYPYLKMEFPKEGVRWMTTEEQGIDAEKWLHQAEEILRNDIGLSDGLTVGDLESRLKTLLGVSVVILRQSGNFWIETSMTRNWTLKEQNDHGKELSVNVQ
jgi:hypothetical protein